MFFGGVEGGATHSNLVICDETGAVVGASKGPGTNHWNLGIEECTNRIVSMVEKAKEDAGLPKDKPLDGLGLTLSGCEQESSNKDLANQVKETGITKEVYVASDTAGSLATAAPNGGMVIIAGTGSNGFLLTPSGETFGCGGWGALFGDEGGAFWISLKAVKTIFDDMDGLKSSSFDTTKVWAQIKEHFGAEDRADLLPHAYKHFDKSFFAGLTVRLSKLAEEGDELSQHLFAEAGSALASHIIALTRRTTVDKLRIVCVGSVWKSWGFLKPGVLRELAANKLKTELEFVRLQVSSALGAAWLGAKHINFDLPRDESKYCDIFYTYRPSEHLKLSNGVNNGINGIGDVKTC